MTARSGIGRRRGSSAGKKSPLTSLAVAAVSFAITFIIVLVVGYRSFTPSTSSTNVGIRTRAYKTHDANLDASEKDKEIDESVSKQFGKWAGILKADLNLVGIQTYGMINASDSKKNAKKKRGAPSVQGYEGVKASFCKLDWERYKKDPPSYPMFRMLVSRKSFNWLFLQTLLVNIANT